MELIETVTLRNNNKLLKYIYKGSFGKVYKLDIINNKNSNIYYDIHFPDEWLFNEKESQYDGKKWITGPLNCNYCRKQGIWNGVFIGYCNKCAEIHMYERGRGLFGYKTDKGKPYEVEKIIKNKYIIDTPHFSSIFDTYLKNVNINEIGDVELNKIYKNGY